MKFSIGDRLVLLSILPQHGDLTTIKIIGKMKDDLSFSEEEHKTLKFRNEGEQIFWDTGIPDKEINFGEKATDIIVESFKELDKQKRLRVEHIPLYEKFVM